MGKKMTISEFKQFVVDETKRLYKINLFREERKSLRENLETETSIEQEVYDEIEMRMRPTDSRLPYDEIVDIANEYGMDEENVAQIMFQYVAKREQEKEEELKQTIHYIINQDFGGEAPDFKTFYSIFVNYDESANYETNQVQQMYDKLTKDPSQLSLFERVFKNALLEINTNSNNIYYNKYHTLTVREPIITDVVSILSKNPNAVKFTNKAEFDAFSEKQRYFSASHSHCFYTKEEYDNWSKSGNKHKDPDSEASVMVFETGREPVQIWDNKNSIGYVVPSDKTLK